VKALLYLLIAALAAAVLAGCGEKKETLGDPTVTYAPGVVASSPPWRPEYAHLKQRIAKLGLPPVGKEENHTHSVMHIYNDGILIQLQPNIGWYPPKRVFSSVHTHDASGIVHMESVRPHKFTIGDFFAIWGVPFGTKTLGNLRADGDKQVHVYVNGKRVANPVGYVMRDQDNIAIGYGTDGSFPHVPDKSALKTVSGKGHGQATCSKGGGGGKKTSCVDEAGG
jgi:hypothetical protein